MASVLKVDKLDPQSGTALEIGTSGDTITVPSGATFVVAGTTEITGTNNVQRPNVNPLIINGDMEIAQRGTSFTSNGYTLDRWTMDESTDGAVTVTQDTDVPSGYGFANSLKIDCTTADASIGAAQYAAMIMFFEGQDLQLFKYGTSSAENVTLSFWVKAVKTGTYCIRWVKEAGSGTRYETPIEYTISSGSTWEKKVINLSPTAGSTSLITGVAGAIASNNSAGFRIGFTLAAGTDFHATNDTWVAGSDKMSTSNQVNGLDSTSNNFWLTGVQLEVGEYTSSTIPPFQHESYGDNLERCQRYAYVISGDNQVLGFGFGKGSDNVVGPIIFPTTMRSAPTTTTTTATTAYKFQGSKPDGTGQDQNIDGSSNILEQAGTRGITYKMDGLSTVGGGSTGFFRTNSASAKIVFSSEL